MRSLLTVILALGCAEAAAPGPTPRAETVLISVRTEAAVAEEVLNGTSPRLTVGRVCYVGGSPPLGAQAMRSLVRLNRVDSLLRSIDAPTVEGRVYAHVGLFELGHITEHDLRQYLTQVADQVEACQGCIVGKTSALGAVAQYYQLDQF